MPSRLLWVVTPHFASPPCPCVPTVFPFLSRLQDPLRTSVRSQHCLVETSHAFLLLRLQPQVPITALRPNIFLSPRNRDALPGLSCPKHASAESVKACFPLFLELASVRSVPGLFVLLWALYSDASYFIFLLGGFISWLVRRQGVECLSPSGMEDT